MDPGEVAIAALAMIELRLLAVPEDAERHEARQIHGKARREAGERQPEFALAVDAGGFGHADVDDEHGKGKSEDAVAEAGEPVEAASGEAVIDDVAVFRDAQGALASDRTRPTLSRRHCSRN